MTQGTTVQVRGPLYLPGDLVQAQATVAGQVYQVTRHVPLKEQPFRDAIEAHMFRELFAMVYEKELKQP